MTSWAASAERRRYQEGSPAQVVATSDYTYDAAGRLSNLHHKTATASTIANYTFTFDAAADRYPRPIIA